MEIEEAIRSRKSTKKFSSKKPDWRDVIECIDNARFTPMSGNIFSPRFILIQEKNLLEKIADATTQDFVKDVKMMIVVCSEEKLTKNSYPELSAHFIRQQAGATIQNLLLSLESRKIDSCWVGYFNEKEIRKILSIPEEIIIEAIIPVGYSKTKTKKKDPPCNLENCLYYDKYKEKYMNPPKKLTS